MIMLVLLLMSIIGYAENSSKSSVDLDQMEILSTAIKRRSATLIALYEVSEKESIPMLEIESSMMEVENLVMQLEDQISTLSPSP